MRSAAGSHVEVYPPHQSAMTGPWPMAHRTFILDDTRRRALSQALKYATDIFSSLVDAQDVLYLVKKPDVSEVQEQLFTNSLESFLLLCTQEAQGQPLSLRPADTIACTRVESGA